jgi:hypothetical protein
MPLMRCFTADQESGPNCGSSVGMAVLPLSEAETVEKLVEYAVHQGQEARSMNGETSLQAETKIHLDRRRKFRQSWGIGMNPSMEHIYLPEFHQALYKHRTIQGEEQALISVMEYPNPPTYPNLDVEGLVAHGVVPDSEQDSGAQGWIRTARKKMFEEAGLFVPMDLFDESLLPDDGLRFTHGPFPIPTRTRYVYQGY